MKIDRNDLCPCGSGRKYKNCCLEDQGWGLAHEGPSSCVCGAPRTSGGRPPAFALTPFLFQEPVRFLVDPFASADRDNFDDIPYHPIDDPEGAYPEAAQAGKFVFQRPSRRGVGKNRLQSRPGFPLQGRMHATDKFSDLVRHPELVKRLSDQGLLSEQFVEGVQARFFLLQCP